LKERDLYVKTPLSNKGFENIEKRICSQFMGASFVNQGQKSCFSVPMFLLPIPSEFNQDNFYILLEKLVKEAKRNGIAIPHFVFDASKSQVASFINNSKRKKMLNDEEFEKLKKLIGDDEFPECIVLQIDGIDVIFTICPVHIIKRIATTGRASHIKEKSKNKLDLNAEEKEYVRELAVDFNILGTDFFDCQIKYFYLKEIIKNKDNLFSHFRSLTLNDLQNLNDRNLFFKIKTKKKKIKKKKHTKK
jgi:hypothetical protein